MKDYQLEYSKWLQHETLDESLLKELKEIHNQSEEIAERFHKDLEFGTGGLRGIISAGTNRINIYTIRKTTLGLANYIISQGPKAMKQGVAIAYDSRKFSKEFAEEAAKVLATKNIQVYLFSELKPTPLLSFAVRKLGAYSGIVITASHNPPEYNGYKVYNQFGGQVTEEIVADIYEQIALIEDALHFDVIDLQTGMDSGLITVLQDEIDQEYLLAVEQLQLNKELTMKNGGQVTIVYTPLHGTGNKLVRRILAQAGFTNVYVVPEQEHPDAEFRTVAAPNPEDLSVFALAEILAKQQEADIIMATDPDADRLGVLVKNAKGDYQGLSGNQLGALILNYLLEERKKANRLPVNGVLLKTIVTSELGQRIAEKYQVQTVNTLTGFKYIGEKIREFELSKQYSFLFGYEESYGFLAYDIARDKDAVQIAGLVAEMVLKYKLLGKNLFEVLEDIYQEHSFHVEDLIAKTFSGIEGSKRIEQIVGFFRENPLKNINGIPVVGLEDYLKGQKIAYPTSTVTEITLPKANVLKILLADGSWIAVRPSGTEPKIKFYVAVVADKYSFALTKLEKLKEEILKMISI